MEPRDIKALILKYEEGVADPSELKQLEKLIEDGVIELNQLHELNKFQDKVISTADPIPPLSMDDKFYGSLLKEKSRMKWFKISLPIPDLLAFLPRMAFALVILMVGVAGGYWLRKPAAPDDQVVAMSQQIGELREMMMLSLLEKESASERLRAVSLTSEMDQASHKVTSALLQTLNNDANVNVRLAAMDALRPYVKDNSVRTELVRSIALQESPLVQVALAELMRDIQEKRSVKEFNKILDGKNTPQEVKKRIKEKIQVLI